MSRMTLWSTAQRLFAASFLVLSLAGCSSPYRGPPSSHFDGSRFFNPGQVKASSVGGYLWLRLTVAQGEWPDSVPLHPVPPPPIRVDDGSARVTLIGHATVLVQTHGLNLLIDPVWSERASPLSFVGPRRVTPPGVALSAMPPIDVVLISHDHYDHLDLPTLAQLDARDRPRVIVPLGNRALVARAMPGSRVSEHDWGEQLALSEPVKLWLEPMLHGSGRSPWNQQASLWAAFVIEAGDLRLLHVGDSGRGDGAMFRATGAKFGRFDLAILPIGAYEPVSFMADSHMTPAEAVLIVDEVHARQAMAHHFEAFALGFEAYDAPRRALADALRQRGWPPERFVAPRPGQSLIVRSAQSMTHGDLNEAR